MVYKAEDFLRLLDGIDDRYKSEFVHPIDVVAVTGCADFERQDLDEAKIRIRCGGECEKKCQWCNHLDYFDRLIAEHQPKNILLIPECCSPYPEWYVRMLCDEYPGIWWQSSDIRGVAFPDKGMENMANAFHAREGLKNQKITKVTFTPTT